MANINLMFEFEEFLSSRTFLYCETDADAKLALKVLGDNGFNVSNPGRHGANTYYGSVYSDSNNNIIGVGKGFIEIHKISQKNIYCFLNIKL